jgi:hypothetical protein
MSKLVPHPQLLVASGLSTILNWLPINSIVKSILLPFNSSRLGPSITTFAPDPSSAAKTVSSSSSSPTFASSGNGGERGVLDDIALGSLDEALSAGDDFPRVESKEKDSTGGRVVSDIKYWKPWQPPLSTCIRRARSGFESWDMISFRR